MKKHHTCLSKLGNENGEPNRFVPEKCLPLPAVACNRLLLDAMRLRLELELFLDAPKPHLRR